MAMPVRSSDSTPELVPASEPAWTEAAAAAQDSPYSDGRLWNGAMVAAEIHGYLEQGLRAMVEIGRRLCWAKQTLGHGRFLKWLDAEVRFIGERQARNYMKIADFFAGHPKLLESCAGLGLKKALLLAQLPDEVVEDATNLGVVADIPLDRLDKVPYPELEKQLRQAKKDREKADEERRAAEEVADRKSQQVDDLVASIHGTDDDELLARVRKMRKTWDDAMALIGLGLDAMATRAAEGTLSPRVRAEVMALVEYQSTWAEYEALRFRGAMGEEVFGVQFEDALSRPRPLASRYQIPEDRLAPTFEESAPATAHVRPGSREPALRVVSSTPSGETSANDESAGLLSEAEADTIATQVGVKSIAVQKVLGWYAEGVATPGIVDRLRMWARGKPDLAVGTSDASRVVRQVLTMAGQDPDQWAAQK